MMPYTLYGYGISAGITLIGVILIILTSHKIAGVVIGSIGIAGFVIIIMIRDKIMNTISSLIKSA